MDYEAGYVYKLMDQGGPTDNREPLSQRMYLPMRLLAEFLLK